MPRKKRQPQQTQLFELELSKRDFDKSISPQRLQHEKKLMLDLLAAASALGLPAIHIQNFCGNHFKVSCPHCGNSVVAHCKKILNANLKGHHDIIGIAWTIETKHKTTKLKPQDAAPSLFQNLVQESFYKRKGIPTLLVNESNAEEAIAFLRKLADARNH